LFFPMPIKEYHLKHSLTLSKEYWVQKLMALRCSLN